MAKPAARKLKVFQAQLGFFDTVVAAPSQAAALRAWGMHQNLFANGQARLTEDADAIEAALAHPETPLKRAVGSNDPFGLEATLPDVPDAPKRKASAKPTARAKPEAPKRPQADRSALNAAEAALKKLDEDRKDEEENLRREQDALDSRKAAAKAAHVAAHKASTAAVVEARQAYRKAGGSD
jgi:hypothetical protein